MNMPASSSGLASPSAADSATPWLQRSWGLALLGGLAALAVYFIVRPDIALDAKGSIPLRLALGTFLGVGALAFGFVVERNRLKSSLVFAVAAGLVTAFAMYWNAPDGSQVNDEPWRILCAALTVGIAAPLFQALRDRKPGEPLSYSNAHNRAWLSVVLWCADWAFVLIVWLMAHLLSELFDLIGIRLLKDLLGKELTAFVLIGTALGAATGVLRDREAILGMLQRVVTTVLAVLAPVLALGLVVFLAALPFTGLTPLWEATKSTTPILLICVIGALALTNAAIGDRPEHEARHPVLRVSMIALSLAILPLGVIAAISTGIRINQYGLTPDRLWAIIFTGIACTYGLAYLAALVRGRLDFAPLIRSSNLKLAFGLCALAFLLSTPLINFGALATRDQVARLNRGATPPDKFDWEALRFDYGPAGVAALQKLAKEGKTPAIRQAASDALKKKTKWADPTLGFPEIKDEQLTILPHPTPLPSELRKLLSSYGACSAHMRCVIIHEADSDEAVIVTNSDANVWRRDGTTWRNVTSLPPHRRTNLTPEQRTALEKQRASALAAGQVEVRAVTRRQVFVAGEPVGQPFE